ncbi:MAG: NDP-hexose 2,3-dehydratase family protein [Candidatus Omnitrophica bacterium]|nr:NDP-hexose 2,3-dehydratase family protein [Candidatus Omnitrophota bacterium]MDD5429610.1 NDP-hexose 2,3-dehydratase family protein [Candidatus Omnitrophota bacterium]
MQRNLVFLKSVFAENSKVTKLDSFFRWFNIQKENVDVEVNKIPFNDLGLWYFDAQTKALKHRSNKFFSIEGIRVETNYGKIPKWDQPIINQPEIGYLGLIAKEFDGVLHFLIQAKVEPGNINYVQLSPTLQATRSNYTQVHSGKKPLYLEYFKNAKPQDILLDQLQSEQGARFIKKRNRNLIIKVDKDIPVYDHFVWVTLKQIKKLLRFDNLVNMDTRAVISGITFGYFEPQVINFFTFLYNSNKNPINKAFLKSALPSNSSVNSLEDIIHYITQLKSTLNLKITNIPLDQLKNWTLGENEIYHNEHKYFKVLAIDVKVKGREITKWSQPMVKPVQEGLCAFVCKEINGLLHFVVQIKLECGNYDIVELAPTVQCLTGDYPLAREGKLPFIDYVLKAKPEQIIYNVLQSEEGGRFFNEQNRNMIVLANDEVSNELPPNYIWVTLSQLQTFLKFNNYLNVQARSLISAISFYNES